MQVTVAKTAGFCFGVRRALELTQKSAALSPTCTLGELIHNRKVVEELAGQGVTVIERPEDAPAGTAVVIRSHGVGPQEASAAASAVSALPEVRAYLLEQQRSLARQYNVIMDGRDIGTVVLPQATIKIYLTAAPEARARRRWLEQQQKGIKESYEDVLAAVIKRDYDDSHRAAAPLRQAEDAWLCDSTHLDFEGTVQAILAYIRQRIGEVPCR